MGRVAEVDLRKSYPDAPDAREVVRRNVRAVKAAVFGLQSVRKRAAAGASSGESQAADVDPFSSLVKEGRVVAPPFDLLTLATIPENSTEVGPAIDAMSVNVELFGYRVKPRVPVDEGTPAETLRVLDEERDRVENFFERAFDGESLEDVREKLRKDLESTGNAYLEFIENPVTGELDGLAHLPSWTMRIGRRDAEGTEYVQRSIFKRSTRVRVPLSEALDLRKRRRGGRVETYELRESVRVKRFRRYVQIADGKATWFKELDDPRLISSLTGEVVTPEELRAEALDGAEVPRFTLDVDGKLRIKTGVVGFPVSRAANPVRHRAIYSPRSPYGIPRFIGHLFSIFGSRAAEEINFTTFKNNNIPSMLVSVTNAQLTDESIDRLEEFVESAIQSDDNYSKFLLLEAEPVMEGMRDPGSMKIEVKPLTKEQHTDALFVKYQEANDDRVRRAWRFPPIFVGKSEDFSGKTIEASRKLADEQVFSPERAKVDRFFTRDVLLRLNVVWSTFQSLSPNVTENADLVRLLAQGEKTGGLTPRIARDLIGRVVNEDLGEIDADLIPPDQPFSLTLAQVMKSDAASEAIGGGEPTSQGRAGLQVAGPGRDRASEPAAPDLEEDQLNRLAKLLREEVRARFMGYLPPAFEADAEDGDPVEDSLRVDMEVDVDA